MLVYYSLNNLVIKILKNLNLNLKCMDKLIDKFLSWMPGGIFGLLSVVIIIIGDIVAYMSFSGYNFFKNMISDLGIGPGGIFFNLSVIISGIIILPYYIHLAKYFSGEKMLNKLRRYALVTSIISCLTFSSLGFFPALKTNIIIYYIHGTLATISVASGLGYLLLFSTLMLKAKNFSKAQAYHGFIVAAFYFSFLMTWNPFLEWIMNFAIISWITINSLYMLFHNFNLKEHVNEKY
jgi:hypothetical protein